MTSPAQLKYLDAMGIPVWVSRDLVVIEKLAGESNSTVDLDVSNSPKTLTIDSSQNAKNILESLEADQAKSQNKHKQSKATIDNVVAKSVDSAKLTDQASSSFSSTTKTKAVKANSENLLYQTAHHNIYAQGNESADWMIIGHSPEPFNGIGQEPFASDAGDLLDNMLRAVGIEHPRQQAYIINVLDLNQAADEQLLNEAKLAIKQKLMSVIVKVKPKIILLVGQIAAQNLLDCTDPLIIMRSKIHNITDAEIPCIVTYYPSYLLLKPIDKRKAWNDLKLAMHLLKKVS